MKVNVFDIFARTDYHGIAVISIVDSLLNGGMLLWDPADCSRGQRTYNQQQDKTKQNHLFHFYALSGESHTTFKYIVLLQNLIDRVTTK